MKIRVESDKIVKAVKKLHGIELVLEDVVDALEGIHLILKRPESMEEGDFSGLKEIKVTSQRDYETSAVEYRMSFLLEFLFEEPVPLETRVSALKAFQDFLNRL